MFKVVLNDGQTEMPEDDIFYIIAKEGVYLKKKLGVMESIAPVKKISILESVNSMARMHITKIPAKWIAKVIGFFQAVYEQHKSEAIVLLFYDEETGKHKIVPPMQKVAGATCDYDKGITIEGMTMIGTIHSHARMSAFHSGTDDADEEHFDGLHITLGDLDEEYPSMSASIVANGHRIMIDPNDYIDGLVLMAETNPVENKPVRTVYKWVDGKLVKDEQETSRYVYSHKKFDRRYDVIVHPHERVFNKKWLKMVEKGTYTIKSWRQGAWYGYNAHGYGAHRHHAWGKHYDPAAWGGFNQGALPHTGTRVSPQNLCQPPGTDPKLLPHTADGEYVPCVTCIHKECKLVNEVEDDDDFTDLIFLCLECGEVIKEDTVDEDLQCSTCKTDEYLHLIEDEDLINGYIPSDEYDHLFEKSQTDVVENSRYTTCATCGNGFHLPDDDAICPFCYSLVKQLTSDQLVPSEQMIPSEDVLESQLETDSGALLDPEVEEANDAAILEAAKQEDKTIERIPEPGSRALPIPEDSGQKSIVREMFRRAFWREKDND
jgi:PRTRC genetic system protein A